EHGQSRVRGEHAAPAVAAEGDDHHLVQTVDAAVHGASAARARGTALGMTTSIRGGPGHLRAAGHSRALARDRAGDDATPADAARQVLGRPGVRVSRPVYSCRAGPRTGTTPALPRGVEHG